MSLSKLLVLPPEVLEAIFNFIEPKFLKLIQDIPQIRPYVLRVLYSDVTLKCYEYQDSRISPINRQFIIGAQFRDLSEPFSGVLTLDELRVIIEENDLPPPRKIHFNDPMDLVEAHASSPDLLNDCEIGISFNYCASHQTIDDTLLKQLKEYPYNVTRLDAYPFMDESKYGSNEKWFNNVKSLNIENMCSLKKLFSQANFDNLVDLSLSMNMGDDFKVDDFELLPPGLEKLECRICTFMYHDDFCQIRFPVGLTELSLSIICFTNGDHGPELNAPVFDLSYLENLKKLKYALPTENIKFPKNLLELESSCSVPLRQLYICCPDLVKLKCCHFSQITGDFPKKVTNLTTIVSGLTDLFEYWQNATRKTDDSKRRKLDDSSHFLSKILSQLHHFKVSYFDRDPVKFTIFPKESAAYDFSNMKTFEMHFEDGSIIGDIPSSLTSLRVSRTKDLDFSRFKYFDNLVDVRFSKMNEISKVKCEFGPSLKYLEIYESKIKAIDIIAPKLECLIVTCTSLSTISTLTFKVPESLLELDISENRIRKIDDSFRFPDNLQVLDISGNKLSKLENLPSKLKKLRGGDRIFDPFYESNLGSAFNPEVFYTTSFDCSKFKSLTHLDLSFRCHKGRYLSLDIFPKSLVFLNLSGMEFAAIVGKFTDFKNLKTLALEKSVLHEYLEQTDYTIRQGKEEHYFGPSMRYLYNLESSVPKELYNKVVDDIKRGNNSKKFIVIKDTA